MFLARWLVLSFVGFAGVTYGEEKLTEGMVNPGFHEQPAWFKNSFLDLKDDVAEAAAQNKRVVLYFYQDGCPYCKKLLEVNFTQKDIADLARARFDVVAVNMWGDRDVVNISGETLTEKRLAAQMRVMFTPTLLFLNEKGQTALRVNGYYPPHKFKAALDYVAAGQEAKEGFRDYFARLDPQPPAGKLHTEPYLIKGADLKSSRHAGRYLVALFEQKECPGCDELHGDVLKRPETRELLGRYDVAQVDIWSKDAITAPDGRKTTAAEWSKTLNIQYTPSLVFFDPQGNEVFRTEAYLKSFHIQSVLDYVSSGAYLKEPSFQRYIEVRADGLREQGVTIDLMR